MRRILLGIAGLAVLSGCGSPEEREAAACKSTTMAFVMSQEFVKQRLKSPATAEFPYITDRGVNVYQMEPDTACKHSVTAYVDSQNGFGAMIRSTYTVVMRKVHGEDSWTASDLVIH